MVIKTIEYYPDGTVKRIEYQDYPVFAPMPTYPVPQYPLPYQWPTVICCDNQIVYTN